MKRRAILARPRLEDPIPDLVFAEDSIPAIFAIPPDPFIVLTSNIFAILGSRALYFLLADVADRFHLLKYCLAMVLTFIGTKMLIAPLNHVPVVASRATIVVLIGASVVASLIVTRGGHPVVRHVRAHT